MSTKWVRPFTVVMATMGQEEKFVQLDNGVEVLFCAIGPGAVFCLREQFNMVE